MRVKVYRPFHIKIHFVGLGTRHAMSMDLLQVLIYTICCFAAMVTGAIGIGFPLIATPLLSMVIDVKSAIVLLLIPTLMLTLTNSFKGGPWKKSIALYWPLVIYGMIGNFLGARLLILVPAENFKPLLAFAIILYLISGRIGLDFSWVRRKQQVAMAFFGLVAGLLGGTVNVMLPALVIFSIENKMEKTITIQVLNSCFLFGKFIQGAVFLQAGLFTVEVLKLSIPLALVCLATMLMAMRLRNKLSDTVFRNWLKGLLLIISSILTFQFLVNYSQ